jgi:hypothetical protein
MEKLLTIVLASSLLLLATLAGHASSRSSLHPSSLDTQRGHVLGRKGREEPAYPHYRREGELREQHEVSSYFPQKFQCREKQFLLHFVQRLGGSTAEAVAWSCACLSLHTPSFVQFILERNIWLFRRSIINPELLIS